MENTMATVQTNGSSAVTTNSTVNNGGTAVNVGSASTVLKSRDLGRDSQGVFGSTVISNATVDYADPALSSGVFAYTNAGPIAMKVTSTLAGSEVNTFLRSAASDTLNRRSIHRQEKVRTTRTSTAFRQGYWNLYNGQWSTTPTTAVDNFWGASSGSSSTSTDAAASPTRTAPGDLVYKLGSKNPVSVSYSSKTT